MKKKEDAIRLSGQVVAYEWDEDLPRRVMIIDDNQHEYKVEASGRGLSLVEYEDSWVEAEGTIRRRDGDRYIHVTSFRLEDEFENGWDDTDY